MTCNVIYAGKYNIKEGKKSIFLAGPTPRSSTVMDGCGEGKSWRPEAIQILESFGFEGNVFVPEPIEGEYWPSYDDELNWENYCLDYCDCIIFWIPRNMENMPALTTNDEWGYWKSSGKCVLGAPKDAFKVRYQIWWAKKLSIPFSNTLVYTCHYAIHYTNQGEHRDAFQFSEYPDDYQECKECGYDHEYEFHSAYRWHKKRGNIIDTFYCEMCCGFHAEHLICQVTGKDNVSCIKDI